jgi:branched-chain amino acid transport system permease protein
VVAAPLPMLKNVVSAYVARWLLLLGAAFVAIVILVPDGLVPGVRQAWARRRGRAERPAVAPAAGAHAAPPPEGASSAAQPSAAAGRGTSA